MNPEPCIAHLSQSVFELASFPGRNCQAAAVWQRYNCAVASLSDGYIPLRINLDETSVYSIEIHILLFIDSKF